MQGQIDAYVFGAALPFFLEIVQDDYARLRDRRRRLGRGRPLFAVSDASVRRLVCHRRSSAQQQASSATEKRLNDSLDAARVRVKVSFAMRVVGMLM